MVAPLTATERARLAAQGALVEPPKKPHVDPEPVTPSAVETACRDWQTALAGARAAFAKLGEAERHYIAVCEAAKGAPSRRRIPKVDPYNVPRA